MPRKPRVNVENGIYHAFARGNNRMALYRDDVDRDVYLETLSRVVGAFRWRFLAYCLMTNHLHLLVETPEANLSTGMQILHGQYAQAFNSRHGRSGHVFQGRYGAVLVGSDAHLCATAAYIARNPVAAKLCDRPDGWTWSSFGATMGGPAPSWLDVDRLLSFFDSDRTAARRSLADMVVEQTVWDLALDRSSSQEGSDPGSRRMGSILAQFRGV